MSSLIIKKNRMKKKLLSVVLFTIIISTVMAQKRENYKVIIKTLKSDTINVSVDSLWAILREFDKVGDWTSMLNHSEGYGNPEFEGVSCRGRVCETGSGGPGKVIEELTMFNDEKRELAYELTEGAPGFVKFAGNHWAAFAVGTNQSQVTMEVTMHLSKFMGFFLGGFIKKDMKKQVSVFLDELKLYAETGEISEAKKKQIEKMKKKAQLST